MLASEVSGVPFSFTAHRWDIAEDNLLATKVRAAAFARAIDRLGAEELASLANAKTSEIVVIHMGVAAARRRATRELATPPSVVIPASLIEIKGHTYLLQAVALLAERGTPVRLEIVGDGPERAPIEREIDSRRLRDHVVVRGFVSHDQLLHELEDGRYDIAVLPSAGGGGGFPRGHPGRADGSARSRRAPSEPGWAAFRSCSTMERACSSRSATPKRSPMRSGGSWPTPPTGKPWSSAGMRASGRSSRSSRSLRRAGHRFLSPS